MNEKTQNLNKDKTTQENAANEGENNSFVSSDREANPLFSDSILPVNDERENISDEERDKQIKNEPDTARLRSERQSVIDNENKKDE